MTKTSDEGRMGRLTDKLTVSSLSDHKTHGTFKCLPSGHLASARLGSSRTLKHPSSYFCIITHLLFTNRHIWQ